MNPVSASLPVSPFQSWVDKNGLAKHFDVSPRTISNWQAAGLIPFVRVGHVVRFNVSQVEEALSR
jgi:excisionase family DNA binding protein